MTDYYPFGNERNRSVDGKYRWGFGGHEKDNEIKGEGNYLSFGDYGYDSRIGRRYRTEPKSILLPNISTYVYGLNSPIQTIDSDGKFPILINGNTGNDAERGASVYWSANIIKVISEKLGYKFGGDVSGSSSSTRNSRFSGDFFFVDGNRKAVADDNDQLSLSNENAMWPNDRAKAGEMVAKIDAKVVWEKLKESMNEEGKVTEQIQVFTHSRGSAFGNEYVNVLRQEIVTLAKKEGIGFAYDEGLVIDLVVHMAPHQSNYINVPNTKTTTVAVAHTDDMLAGNDVTGDVTNVHSNLGKGASGHRNSSFGMELRMILNVFKKSSKESFKENLSKSYKSATHYSGKGKVK